MIASRVVEYTDETVTARLVISRATVLIGMRRTRMLEEGKAALKDETDIDRIILRNYLFPDLMAPVSEGSLVIEGVEKWPLDFETFLTLPDSLVNRWETEVYAANPHWSPTPPKKPDPKASATRSTAESTVTSRARRKQKTTSAT